MYSFIVVVSVPILCTVCMSTISSRIEKGYCRASFYTDKQQHVFVTTLHSPAWSKLRYITAGKTRCRQQHGTASNPIHLHTSTS